MIILILLITQGQSALKVRAKVNDCFEKQYKFIMSDHPHPALIAGLGYGKTHAIPRRFARLWTKAIKEGIKDPVLFNVTLKSSLNKSAIKPAFIQFFKKYQLKYDYKGAQDEQCFIVYFRGNEVKIYLYSAQKPEDIVSINAIGGNIDEHDVNRVAIQPELWDKCLGRCRVGSNPSLSITTTAEGFKHAYWLCERSKFEDFDGNKWTNDEGKEIVKEPIAEYIQASTHENPFLSPNYIPNLVRSLDPDRAEAYINGTFINFTSGRVFKWFTDDLIQVDDRRGDLYTFWDFGLRNMMYVGFASVIGNHVHVYSEIGVRGQTTDQVCDTIERDHMRHPETIFDYCDPAGDQHDSSSGDRNDVNIMRKYGFNPRWMQSRIVARTRLINNLHHKKRLTIDPKCKHLIDSMRYSVYPPILNGVADERPEKDNIYDHARDALGYLVINLFRHEAVR